MYQGDHLTNLNIIRMIRFLNLTSYKKLLFLEKNIQILYLAT